MPRSLTQITFDAYDLIKYPGNSQVINWKQQNKNNQWHLHYWKFRERE